MTLMQWADNGWLTSHKTSTQEIGNLLAIVERDLKDAIEGGISAANYLDTCRSKRNIVEYDYIGGVTENDANELIDFVKDLKHEVQRWLERQHPELA